MQVMIIKVHREDIVEGRVLARVFFVVRFHFFGAHAEDDVDVVLAEHVRRAEVAAADLADGQLV